MASYTLDNAPSESEISETENRIALDAGDQVDPQVTHPNTVTIARQDDDAATSQTIFSGDKVCPFRLHDQITFHNGFSKIIELTDIGLVTDLAVGFFARSANEEDQDETSYFFEVYTSGNAPVGHSDPSYQRILRQPAATGYYEGMPFSLFDESDSDSIENLVESANRRLPLKKIVSLFRGVLDLTISSHENGFLVLGISPWTIRIVTEDYPKRRPSGGAQGTPKVRRDFTSDFGLISSLNESLGEATNPDLPSYVSPFEEVPFGDDSLPTLEFNTENHDDEFVAPLTTETMVEGRGTFFSKHEEAFAPTTVDYVDVNHEEPCELTSVVELTSDTEEMVTQSTYLLTPPLDTSLVEETDFEGNDGSSIHYHALFDGLEKFYPIGEMPSSVPVITGFAASEFMLGVTRMVGPQADVFSLGALLFYLVTGYVPPSSVHSRFAPALPMRNFRDDFPPGLEAVVHRATCVDPEERYTSVRQLRSDFEYAISQIEQRQKQSKNKRSFSVVRAAVDTHIGIAKGKRCAINQDSVFSAVSENGRLALVVVADGVTRAVFGSGDKASSYVTDAAAKIWDKLLEEYENEGTVNARSAINKILNEANEHLVDYVNEHHYPFSGGVHEVMGSTVLIACVLDGIVTLASLGDSRAYLYSNLGLEQLTTDHNLWTLNVIEDSVGIDYVRSMPYSDALARCLGSFKIVEGRLIPLPSEPDIQEFFFRKGDRLLLATDGLTDYIGMNRDAVEDAIVEILRRENDPALAALELILCANRGGGGDNIGVGVIDFH